MMHVAVLTGGPSAEREISLKSAALVCNHLNPDKYITRLIDLTGDGWKDQESGMNLDLNDFSLNLNGEKMSFDFVFLMIHGTPAEDGKIQGYLEMMGIPHSTCDTLSAALSFNKQKCKDYLRNFDIPLAPSVVLKKGQTWSGFELESLGLPVFVKPNCNGSSYGVTKVKTLEEIPQAVQFAMEYDDEVVVESFLPGREFGCGVLREGQLLHSFPVTEIIPKTEFFTYEAKYLGASEEITPANLPPELSGKCQELSMKIYGLLSCRGVVRFDFILVGDTFFLLEANTIPGMSEASIVPQQARAYGWTIEHLLDVIITEGCRKE